MTDAVVIAGAGPAGLILACELRLAGVETVVLEARNRPRPDSPGVAINAGSVEVLSQRGLFDAVKDKTFPLPMIQFALLFLDLEQVPARAKSGVLLHQPVLEAALERRAAELGAEIRRGHEVVDLHQDESGVVVRTRTADGEHETAGRYLVGCDGQDSRVRELTGIGFPSVEPAFNGITGELETTFENLGSLPIGGQYYAAGGQWMCVPVDQDVFRITTSEFGIRPDDAKAPVTVEELRAAVLRLTGSELGEVTPRWLARAGCRIGQAAGYRDGNVFLAGDAALTIFPVNGQALDNALNDAVNLGWKLGAAINGWAPDGLLDTYHGERHPFGELVLTNVLAQVELSGARERVGGLRDFFAELFKLADVNAHVGGVLSGTGVRYPMPGAPPHHLLAGGRLPSPPAGGVAEALSAGRGVLLDRTGGTADLGDLTAWSDRIDLVPLPADPAAAAVVLLRPDGHVAWASETASEIDDLREALTTWFGPER